MTRANRQRLKVTILGSGTSTGIPMVGCSCPVCRSTDPRDSRTRSSILIEYGGHFILVDTATDLRLQALRAALPRVDAVLFTHAHADHVNGIDELRGFHFLHRQVIPCYGSPATMHEIETKFRYIFHSREEQGYAQLLHGQQVNGPFDLFGLTVVPLQFPHGDGEATGYRIGPFAYVTDCGSLPENAREQLYGLEILVLDGLRYSPHPNHLNISSAVKAIRELKPKTGVLTHLTHEVSAADEKQLPDGVVFAYDGMQFILNV